MSEQIFDKVCALALLLGKKSDYWEHRINDRWLIAANWRTEPVISSVQVTVAPNTVYVHHGEDDAAFLAALDREIARAEVSNKTDRSL